MDKNARSNNSKEKSLLLQFLGWSPAQIALDIVIGLVLLLGANARPLWHYFNDTLLLDQQSSFSQFLNQNASWLDRALIRFSQSRVPQIIFWVFLGCMVYVIIWIFRNFVTNVQNDVVASQFIGPTAASGRNYWRPILMRKIFFALSALVFLEVIVGGAKLVVALGGLCEWAVSNFHPWPSLPQLGGSLVAVALMIHVLLIVARITARSWAAVINKL